MKSTIFSAPSKILSIFLFLLFMGMTSNANACAQIVHFQLTNGHETVALNNGGTYNINELPEGFYVEAVISGSEESVSFLVNNLTDGNFEYVIENYVPYTFPAGNDAWDLGAGVFHISTTAFSLPSAGGPVCDQAEINFTLLEDEISCDAFAGSVSIIDNQVIVDNFLSIVTVEPNGDAIIPPGYQQAYVLTEGPDLVIQQLSETASFVIIGAGEFTVHSFVYNPQTLDLGIVQTGTTTGFDVFGLIIPGGGNICADLDVAGTPINDVNQDFCEANSGTLSGGGTLCLSDDNQLTAFPNGDAHVPAGYETVYVLTQGEDLTIINAGATPSFEAPTDGLFTIHSLVYDPNTLDLGIVEIGVTTGFDVFGLLQDGGGDICASLDVAGAQFQVASPFAGSLTPTEAEVTLENGVATISAIPNGEINIPAGYTSIFVLTQGPELLILNASESPEFQVTEAGDYTIHTLVYNPETLNLGIVIPGFFTGFDVFGLIVPGGGPICADLDVAGASISVIEDLSCDAFSGTLSGGGEICNFNDAQLSAIPNGDAIVPEGYEMLYVLTQGEALTIVNAGATPNFDATQDGLFTIHSLVYDPNTLDLGIVEIGVTTGFDVFGLLQDGGGNICASLDVAGAQYHVASPDAGTLTAEETEVTLDGDVATISATPNGDINVPDGYASIYVLTQGADLVIVNAGEVPAFQVSETGEYTIHTLVFDPATLDLSIVVPGVTTGVDVFGLIVPGGGAICADLDVAGAPISVIEEGECTAFAGTLTSDADEYFWSAGFIPVSATPNGDINVPEGYQTLFVLTQGADLVITGVNATPDFQIGAPGQYTIHTLVYDPNTLDLSIVVPGVTTGVDVFGLLQDGGGDICASLDVAGAPFTVTETDGCIADSGTLNLNSTLTCFSNGMATVSAQEAIAPTVPANYEVLYVLTSAFGLVIQDVSTTPVFEVSQAGFYRVHTLVYDPNTLDLSIVQFGVTTGFDVNSLLVQGGGEICASLLLQAPLTLVLPQFFCDFIFGNFFQTHRSLDENNLEALFQRYESYGQLENDLLDSDVMTYPNPVIDELNIELNLLENEQAQITIYDMSGRVVMRDALSGDEIKHRINVNGIAKGQYVLNVLSDVRNVNRSIQVIK